MFGENLRKARKAKKMSQAVLGELILMSQQAIGSWESGRTTPPPQTIALLAEALGVSTAYLLGVCDTDKGIRVPVFGCIPSDTLAGAVEDIIGYVDVPQSWGNSGREYFAIKITGDSMSPEYLDGDTVIFVVANACDTGDDCVVIIGDCDGTFKKVVKQANGIVLQPINTTSYFPAFFSNEDIEDLPLRIIGIAEEIRRRRRKAWNETQA